MNAQVLPLLPQFILHDAEGYAVAKAIQAAMGYFCDTLQAGLDTLYDPDKMPEWRLDELAWETGCMYDYNAGIESKRDWIRNATGYARLLGTPEGLLQYIRGHFPSTEVEEWFDYEGEPYHFRLNIPEKLTLKRFEDVLAAVEYAKNVRSVLDTTGLHLLDEVATVYHATAVNIAEFHVMTTQNQT